MLRITVELVPHGVEYLSRTLSIVEIVNDGTGTPELGNYDLNVIHGPGKGLAKRRIERFERQTLDAVDLAEIALFTLNLARKSVPLEERT